MLYDSSRQKRVIPALLREEVWIGSWREDLELDITGKGGTLVKRGRRVGHTHWWRGWLEAAHEESRARRPVEGCMSGGGNQAEIDLASIFPQKKREKKKKREEKRGEKRR